MPSSRRQFLGALAAAVGTGATPLAAGGSASRREATTGPGRTTPRDDATSDDRPPSHVWAHRYGSAEANDEGLDVIRAHDGGVVFLWQGRSSWELRHLAANGRPGWEATIEAGAYLGGVHRTANGYVVVGADAENETVVRATVDADGRVRDVERYLGDSEDVYGVLTARTADGGVVVVGNVDDVPALEAAKFDATGELAWHRRLDVPGMRPGDAAPAPDGGVYVVGESTGGSSGHSDAHALRLTGAGEVAWRRAYGGAYGDSYDAATATANGFLAGGTLSFGEQDRRRVLVLHDDAGTPVWRRPSTGRSFEDVLAFRDGYLALSDSKSTTAVRRTDRWGRPIWESPVSPVPGPVIRDANAVAAVEGGYVVAATRPYQQSVGSEALVLKLAPPADD
ncbi:hypothetical protein [Halorubellus salinus]|uniref:hypothetical protein n=1 Tax=Halorubellus salinus TaxID=755309 RepID=UPI001D08F970|nr:hypothetical protein [Halorubellus salinus]